MALGTHSCASESRFPRTVITVIRAKDSANITPASMERRAPYFCHCHEHPTSTGKEIHFREQEDYSFVSSDQVATSRHRATISTIPQKMENKYHLKGLSWKIPVKVTWLVPEKHDLFKVTE